MLLFVSSLIWCYCAGSDGVLAIWQDTTDALAAEESKERQERILTEQDCANAIHRKQWSKAIHLGMNTPITVLNVST